MNPTHDHVYRCLLIFKRLVKCTNEVTLQRVEAEVGLTPRSQSHDAGKPWRQE